MRVAYADPPYLGMGRKHYSDHPEHAVYDSVDGHRQLIDRLVDEFPDGWAMSLSARSLRQLLPLCPEDVRVMAWVKPYTRFFPNVNPAYGWEPVIVRGGRKHTRDEPTVLDYIIASPMSAKGKWFRDHGFTGQKPEAFCHWLFVVLGMRAGDELVDLFPGSGAVSEAWDRFQDGWLAA